MNSRTKVVLALAAAVMILNGCGRDEPKREPHSKGAELSHPAKESASNTDVPTTGDTAKEVRADSLVMLKQLSGRTQIMFNGPTFSEATWTNMSLEVPGFGNRAIIASLIELTAMNDSAGGSYLHDYFKWDNYYRQIEQLRSIYPIPQVERYGLSAKWLGIIQAKMVTERLTQDVALMRGRVHLLEAAEVVSADLKPEDPGWQKVTDHIEIRFQKTEGNHNYPRLQTYLYVLRSPTGQSFAGLGEVPCLLGAVGMSAAGNAAATFEQHNARIPGGRNGSLTMPESTSTLRLYLCTKFIEHTLPFAFEKVLVPSNAISAPKPDGVANETANNLFGFYFKEVSFAYSVDQAVDHPLYDLRMRGSAIRDNDSPILCLGQPIIERIVDVGGSVIALPAGGATFKPLPAQLSGGVLRKVRSPFDCTWTDLPRLPRQMQRIEGYMTAVLAGETESRDLALTTNGPGTSLPGNALLRLVSYDPPTEAAWNACFEFAGPYQPTLPKPGEPAITDIRLIDDQGAEIALQMPLRIQTTPKLPGEGHRAIYVSYKLPPGRKATGLRVYVSPKTQAKIIPLIIDMEQPIMADPSEVY